MEPIVWSDDFSVGVKLFDEQHKRLILMLNKMLKDPMAAKDSEVVSEVLSRLTLYAKEHFKAEEELMFEHGYPKTEQQKIQHFLFKKKVAELCFAATDGVEQVPQVLLDFLRNWLTRHILEEDMQYKAFFKEKGVC